MPERAKEREHALLQWSIGERAHASGRWLEATGAYDEALAEELAALTEDERGRIHASAACVAMEQGQVPSAVAHLEAAVQSTTSPDCFWWQAWLAAARAPDETEDHMNAALREASRRGATEVEWRAHRVLSDFEHARGAPMRSRKHAMAAVEALEAIAASLPLDERAAFWAHRCRARMKARAAHPEPMAGTGSNSETAWRLRRLLESLRQVADERDTERLLERIVDAAIELSGAERGFVLLMDAEGGIAPRTIRAVEERAGEATAAFSRSIVELVMIDRKPLITVDAAQDARVSEYLSVHHLKLRAVACLPIAHRGRVLGALYLEHRGGAGSFGEGDVAVLRAFADQAAVALETASLLSEVASQREELRRANDELRQLNTELEGALHAQGLALESTRRELGRFDTAHQGRQWGLVGQSEAMRQLLGVIERVAPTEVPVLIYGESGTGKELIARAIHTHSRRAGGPFVCLSSGAILESLVESELFGHEAGAFTGAHKARAGVFERASGGTLFIDDLPEMPKKMQVELLRVLQEGEVQRIGGARPIAVDVRVVAASQVRVRTLIEQGRFRKDLYYRMSVVEAEVRPLRERLEDLPALCEHLLRRAADGAGSSPKRMSRSALVALRDQSFPGNVRQLEHLLLNASVFCTGDVIEVGDLSLDSSGHKDQPTVSEPLDGPHDFAESYQDFKVSEREKILAALDACGWNRAKAARRLGIARRTFYRRLKEHGIELPSNPS